ncbi:MAG: GIY-YIG nuclease family protein [Candidatus Freyarchaeota archaeon]|nr:GIY-YIG nuclease family protein [Candidatus Jordarchaeia archaeon]MBS7278574.1 GIY-YIG nuclease family protein [Candidatus Jordarchaeia archaeon]
MIDYSYAETGNIPNKLICFLPINHRLVTIMITKPDTRGVYSLLIEITRGTRIQVGGLGIIKLPAGYYVYTGSAMGKGSSSLEGRIKRHLSDKKNNFWHIDYLLADSNSKIIGVIFAETLKNREHDVVRELKNQGEVICKKFGASDCKRDCVSHLLYVRQSLSEILDIIRETYKKLNLEPITIIF